MNPKKNISVCLYFFAEHLKLTQHCILTTKWGVICSAVWLFAIPWAVGRQALLSIEFSRQEYWSGLPCPPLGDLPNSGIEAASLPSSALSVGFLTTSMTWKARSVYCRCHIICRMGSSCSTDFEERMFKNRIWSEIAGGMTFFWLVDSEVKG